MSPLRRIQASPRGRRARGALASGVAVVAFGWHAAPAAATKAVTEEEIHGGSEAEHATQLFRRSKGQEGALIGAGALAGPAAGALRPHGMNLTTPLEDMTSEYIGRIGVGTDRDGGAQFNARVVFDTGSTNLWVASVLCKLSPCSHEKASKFYNPKKSLTQKEFVTKEGAPSTSDIDIVFGTGELKGPLRVDTYRVGPMAVKHQPFAMIREMTGRVFESFPFEGILGLGFPSLSFGGITPFFEHVIDQKLLKNNEFSFYLNADPTKPSAILWGGVNKSLYTGPIRMFPVVQPHYWAIELVDFRIGDKSYGDGGMKRLIFDSGTTFFTAPPMIYDEVVHRLKPAPCSAVESDSERYAPLVYVLRSASGKKYELTLPQDIYMLGDSSQGASALDEGHCKPAFMQLDVPRQYGPAMILGEVFMRSFFTVFSRGSGDVREARIGFARARRGVAPGGLADPGGLQPAAEAEAEADAFAERGGEAGDEVARPGPGAPRRRSGPVAAASARLMRREGGEGGAGGAIMPLEP